MREVDKCQHCKEWVWCDLYKVKYREDLYSENEFRLFLCDPCATKFIEENKNVFYISTVV